MEYIKLAYFASESSQDIAMGAAIVLYAPDWPQWERLSDVPAMLAMLPCDGGCSFWECAREVGHDGPCQP